MNTPLYLFALCALAGCTVGPDYTGAPPVAPHSLQAGHLAHDTATPGRAAAIARWWQTLGDRQLDLLVSQALAHSPDVAEAQARVRQARANLQSEVAAGRPKLSSDAMLLRMRSPDTSDFGFDGTGRGPLSLYLAGFDASWEVDLFGGTRRAVQAADAQAQAAGANLADAQVQLAAEVVQAYTDLRDRQARLALVDATLAVEQQALGLTQQRLERGVASQLQFEQVLTQAQNTQAQRLPLQAQLIEAQDELALLCGLEPGELDNRLAAAAPLPQVPAQVPLANPAALLKARPDVRAAERQLAMRTAQVGQQQAEWFPKLSLTGDLSFSAADPGHLLRNANGTWLALPRLSWNILDFGRVRAGVENAEGSRDEALAHYQGVVLNALKDADVALARYGHQRQNAVLLAEVQASAERAAGLTRQRYEAGTASTLDWLDAERTLYDARQNRIGADAQLLKDFTALHKALGMGWQVAAVTTAQHG
ncbi:efflux transporter outer membrane subunit [Pseudomonas typographi]|uniref:efflux transporter outer membrane subunit n=1 Tax=Pseudomonas typographi TaxID=2715964 RepID=UPI0016890C7F|nr:efflux transporter outer membrane subunit [Pseudomonas typographi]MBD1551218.1 efflux transporter outer membrane subunit [Pseudomonas typographi]MBD1586288.1 efflux transporter outer membrane subunit [Pseudomonas typographi]